MTTIKRLLDRRDIDNCVVVESNYPDFVGSIIEVAMKQLGLGQFDYSSVEYIERGFTFPASISQVVSTIRINF